MIKDYLNRIKEGEYNPAELVLLGVSLFLLGFVIGMKFAPAKISVFGSFNGNQGAVDVPFEMRKKKRGLFGRKKAACCEETSDGCCEDKCEGSIEEK